MLLNYYDPLLLATLPGADEHCCSATSGGPKVPQPCDKQSIFPGPGAKDLGLSCHHLGLAPSTLLVLLRLFCLPTVPTLCCWGLSCLLDSKQSHCKAVYTLQFKVDLMHFPCACFYSVHALSSSKCQPAFLSPHLIWVFSICG